MKTKLVSLLMRFYPKTWRKEYGAELGDMLLARPLTARVCSDVVLSGLWQRLRAIQAPTWVGVGLMCAIVAAIVWNIVTPPRYYERSAVLEYIELLQRPMRSEFYVLILLGLGFGTVVRGAQRPGRAAMRASFIAYLPLTLVGLLMLSGVLHYTELLPGQTPTTFQERGIVYTFYSGVQPIPGQAALGFLLSPLLHLPGAWLWGTIGGRLGRQYANRRSRPVSA